MAYYRCYFLSRDNSFTAVKAVYSDTDSDAIVQSSMLAAQNEQAAGFELWQGGRQVCKHIGTPTPRPRSRAPMVEPPTAAECAQATQRLLSTRGAARGTVPLTLSEARRIRAASQAMAAPAQRRSFS
ncbi:MAG TPA: hypothetical protein VN681_05800 [Stellaceae bacterium]|nr:hypothetical protein [Stellaceae bacterium]